MKEGYAELLVPVLADIPGIKRLNLELGYRFSDYDSAGSVDTYKALVDWTIVDSVRFRGGYQRANRAPNIGELFLPRTQFGRWYAVRRSVFGQQHGSVRRKSGDQPECCGGRACCTSAHGCDRAQVYYANPGSGWLLRSQW